MSGYKGMQLSESLHDYMIISREDILAIARELSRQDDGKRLNLKEASVAYNLDEKTLRRRIEAGIIRAEKNGAMWEVETPAQRAARINNNN